MLYFICKEVNVMNVQKLNRKSFINNILYYETIVKNIFYIISKRILNWKNEYYIFIWLSNIKIIEILIESTEKFMFEEGNGAYGFIWTNKVFN